MGSTGKVEWLLAQARKIAAKDPDFHVVRGPGAGDSRTAGFMAELGLEALHKFREFREPCIERKLCGETALAVDFYFPDEETIVEVALGLPNPGSEFEKDVLKAVMAQECGHKVRRLVFISRPGAIKKCSQPGRAAVIRWALANHGLLIDVFELEGKPRVRKRRRSALRDAR